MKNGNTILKLIIFSLLYADDLQVSINHISFDSLLLTRGWAWYTPSMLAFKPELRSIEANARLNNIGLWSCAAAIPPWIWRSMNYKNKRLYNLCR